MTPNQLKILYNKYKKTLYNTSIRITGDSFDAEEIVQDVIIKYLRYNNMSMEPHQIEAWLRKCCIRESIDMLRRKRALIAAIEKFQEDGSCEEECNEGWEEYLSNGNAEEKITAIREKLEELPVGYRTILSLILFEGYDYSETAEILKISESTARTQYMRGKQKLLQIINN